MPKKCEKERKFQSLAMKNAGGKKQLQNMMIHSYIKENNECIIYNTYKHIK